MNFFVKAGAIIAPFLFAFGSKLANQGLDSLLGNAPSKNDVIRDARVTYVGHIRFRKKMYTIYTVKGANVGFIPIFDERVMIQLTGDGNLSYVTDDGVVLPTLPSSDYLLACEWSEYKESYSDGTSKSFTLARPRFEILDAPTKLLSSGSYIDLSGARSDAPSGQTNGRGLIAVHVHGDSSFDLPNVTLYDVGWSYTASGAQPTTDVVSKFYGYMSGSDKLLIPNAYYQIFVTNAKITWTRGADDLRRYLHAIGVYLTNRAKEGKCVAALMSVPDGICFYVDSVKFGYVVGNNETLTPNGLTSFNLPAAVNPDDVVVEFFMPSPFIWKMVNSINDAQYTAAYDAWSAAQATAQAYLSRNSKPASQGGFTPEEVAAEGGYEVHRQKVLGYQDLLTVPPPDKLSYAYIGVERTFPERVTRKVYTLDYDMAVETTDSEVILLSVD